MNVTTPHLVAVSFLARYFSCRRGRWYSRQTHVGDMASSEARVVSDVLKALSRPPPVVSSAEDRPADNLHQVRQRQKQIDQVLFSLPQDRYDLAVPRKRRGHGDPEPPNPWRQSAKRKWDGRTLEWRRKMHAFDIGVDIDSRKPSTPAEPSSATDAADPDIGGPSCKVCSR